MAHEKAAIPEEVLELSQRFDEWRSARPPRSRLPESMWVAAAEMAQRHGLHCTTKILRLPHMDRLHVWCQAQLDERKVEPNSGLGKAIQYLLRHWPELTLFLRQSGAPLDDNLCERALKKAILHRKNAWFYRTQNGAKVGDLFMSLIPTAGLNNSNPRVHDRVAGASRSQNQPCAVDAVELSRYAGRFRDRRLIPRRCFVATKRTSRPVACDCCAGTNLVRRITTYPVRLSGPLEGKEIHVGRVALYECQTCGQLMPTPAGQAKVERNVAMGIRLFLGQLN